MGLIPVPDGTLRRQRLAVRLVHLDREQLGLLATTQSRLCVSVFWALGDTRTPMRFATLRVALDRGARLGCPISGEGMARASGGDQRRGPDSVGGARGLDRVSAHPFRAPGEDRRFSLGGGRIGAFWAAAIGEAAVALGTKWLLPEGHPVAPGAVVLAVYGGIYLAATWAMGAEEARRLVQSARPVLRWLGL